MAEVDSRLPLLVQVPEFQKPFATVGGALSLKQLMQNVQMQPLELQLRQEQIRGLQDYRQQMMGARDQDRAVRLMELERKRHGPYVSAVKDALAASLGTFALSKNPELAKQSYEQLMIPQWDKAGFTPEQRQQSIQQWTPENAEKYLAPENEGLLYKMAQMAEQYSGPMTDSGDPVPSQDVNLLRTADPAAQVPVMDRITDLQRKPVDKYTPADWQDVDRLIMASRQLKKLGGMTGKLEEAQFIPIPGIGMLQNPYWRMSQDQKNKLEIEQAVARGRALKTAGLPTGSVEVNVNTGENRQGLTKPTANELQGRVADIDAALLRLDNMAETYKPEFLTLPEQAKQKVVGAWASLGLPVDDTTRQRMSDYAWFMADSYDNMNLYIKMITGAAMSQPEAVRIGRGIPNPDTDNPVVFESKLRRSGIVLRRARDAYADTLGKGLPLEKAEEAAKGVLLKGLAEPQTGKTPAKAAPTPSKPAAVDPLKIR